MGYANYFKELAEKTQCKIKTSVVVNGTKVNSEAQKKRTKQISLAKARRVLLIESR